MFSHSTPTPKANSNLRSTLFHGHLLVFSLFAVIIAPRILSYGMFLDGITYASIARNISESAGSCWDLNFTDHWLYHFHSHPPLAFWLDLSALTSSATTCG